MRFAAATAGRLSSGVVPAFPLNLAKLPKRTRPLALTAVCGLAAGLSAVAFQVGINLFYNATIVRLAQVNVTVFLVGSFVVIVGTSLAAGFLLSRFCPEAAGSGIPQLKLAFWKDFGHVPLRVVWVKFIAGVLTVGGGSSLGREGPTVQLAGGVASNLAGRLGVAKQGRRGAAAAGAAAGLAAAFNAPLASITFVLEEIIEDLNSPLLGSVIVAAVLGAFTVHALLGGRPAFDLPAIHAPTWRGYALVPLAAALAALVGVGFQVASLGLRRWFRAGDGQRVPATLRPALGAAATWLLAVAVFLPTGRLGVFSLGYDDLTAALNDGLGWQVAAALLGAKFLATVVGYASGGCGGIFAPNLFLGGMVGAALAGLARAGGVGLNVDDHTLLTVIAMSACLGAVVRAPLTSILIVFEMTHEFALVPALMVGGIISQAVSRALVSHNFYEQVLTDDGHALRTVMPPRDLRGWRDYPVGAVANFQPVVLPDTAPETVRAALDTHPYARFPLARGGDIPPGVVFRREAESELAAGRPVPVRDAPTCLREDAIGEVQMRLVERGQGVILLLDRDGGVVVGLLTLHDLFAGAGVLHQRWRAARLRHGPPARATLPHPCSASSGSKSAPPCGSCPGCSCSSASASRSG